MFLGRVGRVATHPRGVHSSWLGCRRGAAPTTPGKHSLFNPHDPARVSLVMESSDRDRPPIGVVYRECCTKCHSRTFVSNVLRLCTKDEMQGAEDEVEGSVLTYVTKTEFRKQRSRPPSCNSLIYGVSQATRRRRHFVP